MKKLFLFIIMIGVLARIWTINTRGIQFDFDQEQDAKAVMGMIWDHKLTLTGPRVANDSGFFVGPYHYFYMAPFYMLTGGNPIAGPLAVIVSYAIACWLYYWVGTKIFGERSAIIASLIYTFKIDMTAWNVMHSVALGLIVYYLIYRLFETNKGHYLVAAIVGLAANVHLTGLSLSPVAGVAILLSKFRFGLVNSLKLFGAYSLAFLPLLLFDYRHDGIIRRSVGGFVVSSAKGDRTYVWQKIGNSLTFGIEGNQNVRIILWLVIATSLLYFLYRIYLKSRKLALVTAAWMILPTIGLSLYRGNLPEYYFVIALSLVPLALGVMFEQRWLTVIMIISLWGWWNVGQIASKHVTMPLADKLSLMEYLANQKVDRWVNLSFDLPLGMNYGFDYLGRYAKVPLDRSDKGHLYTIVAPSEYKSGNIVAKTFTLWLIRR